MPLYEDLVARALAAQRRAQSLQESPERVQALAAVLREAEEGRVLLLRCAWCGRLRVGDEWLLLETIGSDQTSIAEDLVRRSTHGICPGCLEQVNADVAAHRDRGGRTG